MNIRVLKLLRKEAHEMYGITYHIDEIGRQSYIVGVRYPEDYLAHPTPRSSFTFLKDAIKTLEIKRREYIINAVRDLRVQRKNMNLMHL